MTTILRTILVVFLQSKTVKLLIVDLLRKLAKTTDNNMDDALVDSIQKALFP